MKKIICAFFLFFLGLSSTKAVLCDYGELSNIRKRAMQVNITSDFKEKNETVTFSIMIYNLMPDQYVIDTLTGIRYDYGYDKTNPSQITIKNITKPSVYKFLVYSTQNECNKDALNTLYVTIPTYNPYYKDKLCEGIENYKLCNRWFGTSITYEQFRNQILAYKNFINTEIEEDEEESFIDYLIELYLNNYYIVLPIVILVLSVPIYIIYQKKYKVDF